MDNYIGEIRIFAGTFAPVGWLLCNGALLSIAENETLFSLIGTTYGGDGVNTFGLPNLNGRVIVAKGTLPGGSTYTLGQVGGAESVTLVSTDLPVHSHSFTVSAVAGTSISPANNFLAAPSDPTSNQQTAGLYIPNSDPGFVLRSLAPNTITASGGSLPHENRMPYVTINYIIATAGVYPGFN